MQASTSTAANVERQLGAFIRKFNPTDQRLIRAIRRALRKRFPTANELVWDNYNFFVIGYSPTERPSDAIVSMAARANGVGLCFIHGAKLPDPTKVLLGPGQSDPIHSYRFTSGLGASRSEGSRRGGHRSGADPPSSRRPGETDYSVRRCEAAAAQEIAATQLTR